jgi:hypothetical protein
LCPFFGWNEWLFRIKKELKASWIMNVYSFFFCFRLFLFF